MINTLIVYHYEFYWTFGFLFLREIEVEKPIVQILNNGKWNEEVFEKKKMTLHDYIHLILKTIQIEKPKKVLFVNFRENEEPYFLKLIKNHCLESKCRLEIVTGYLSEEIE